VWSASSSFPPHSQITVKSKTRFPHSRDQTALTESDNPPDLHIKNTENTTTTQNLDRYRVLELEKIIKFETQMTVNRSPREPIFPRLKKLDRLTLNLNQIRPKKPRHTPPQPQPNKA